MKKISLFVAALAIGFAGFAQTAPAKQDPKAPVKTEKKADAKKTDAKKTDAKKTDAKKTDVKAK